MPNKPNLPLPKPHLLIPREDARRRIKAQIERGDALLRVNLAWSVPEHLNVTKRRWVAYTSTLLNAIFDHEASSIGFNNAGVHTKPNDALLEASNFRHEVKEKVLNLTLIFDSLEFIPELPALLPSTTPTTPAVILTPSHKIFVVHGHDEAAKHSVARFIEKLGLTAIILDEQTTNGKLILEQFERHAKEVGFAVVLMTPDDVGYPVGKPKAKKPRARQNVIYELGYFAGRIGREKVCALSKGVEMPSDLDGLLYVKMESDDGWQFKLAKEMHSAGIPVDMTRLLPPPPPKS